MPLAIREELNHRLLNGEQAPKILPWLNSLDEVKAILETDFEGLCVNDENLSQWRKGGYQDWKNRRDRLVHTRELARHSIELAKAGGGNLADGAAAILAGEILDVLEKVTEISGATTSTSPLEPPTSEVAPSGSNLGELLGDLTLAVSRLRKGDQGAETLRQNRERLAQGAEALELERLKYQRLTCELFLKWRDNDRARTIADGPGTADDKVNALGQAMFGELWGK